MDGLKAADVPSTCMCGLHADSRLGVLRFMASAAQAANVDIEYSTSTTRPTREIMLTESVRPT
jgi:hypothetical protein